MKVLSIGETVMEVNDSGFSGTVETLRIQLLVDDSMLQVWPNPSMHTCYAVAVICDPLCDIIVPVDLNDSVHICCPISVKTAILLDGCSAILQVHPQGLRHIRADRRVNEWRAPGRQTIKAAASNERQVRNAHWHAT